MRKLLEMPAARQPVLGTGLDTDGLAAYLCERGYDSEPRRRILGHVRDHGTLEGTVPTWLDPEDEAAAEAVLVSTQPAHPQESDAWGSRLGEPSMFRLLDDCWQLGPAVPADAAIMPPELEEDEEADDLEAWDQAVRDHAGAFSTWLTLFPELI